MAIKGGDLIHVGNTVLIDRAQTAGPGTVNIPQDRIYELGNYRSIGVIHDIPDITFNLESLDASAELEALLTGAMWTSGDYAALAEGTAFDMGAMKPLDVVSQFKPGKTALTPFNVLGSVGIPFLMPDSVSYRFGITDNATQTVSLRGDSLFFSPGAGLIERVVGADLGTPYVLTQPALIYHGDPAAPSSGGVPTRWALSVTTASGRRLFPGVDYTEAGVAHAGGPAAAFDVTLTFSPTFDIADTDYVHIMYATSTLETYPQASHAVASATRPAALRGRNIEVLVGGEAITDRWSTVQSVNIDWRVQLQKDQEMFNAQVVDQDYDVPDVTGSVEIKPRDYVDFYNRIAQILGVTSGEVAGALTQTLLPISVVLHSPDPPFAAIKTLSVSDARFVMPPYQGRVQQKLTSTIPFSSDSGALTVYKGAMPPP